MSIPIENENGNALREHKGAVEISFMVDDDRFAHEIPGQVEVEATVHVKYHYCPAADEYETAVYGPASIESLGVFTLVLSIEGFAWALPGDHPLHDEIHDWCNDQLETEHTDAHETFLGEAAKAVLL